MAVNAQLGGGDARRKRVAVIILLCALYLAALLVLVFGYLSIVSSWTDSLLRFVGL